MRANSAAIQARLRTIPRMVASRCPSVHCGNASFKLNSAVLRSFGVTANNILARPSANARAKERGNAPASLTTLDTTAYAIHSFIVGHYARSIDPLAVIVKLTARESSLELSPGGHRQIRFEACSRKSTVYDFTTVRRNHCDARAAHRLDHSDPEHSLCLLFQPSRSDWIRRSR